MAPVDNPERLAHRAVVASPSSTDKTRPTEREENTLDGGESMTRLLEETSIWMDTDRDGLSVELLASDPKVGGPVKRTEVREIMGDAVSQHTDMLDARLRREQEIP